QLSGPDFYRAMGVTLSPELDLRVPPVLVLGRDMEGGQAGVLPASPGHSVGAVAMEIIRPSIESVVMQVPSSPTRGWRDWHALCTPFLSLSPSGPIHTSFAPFSKLSQVPCWGNIYIGETTAKSAPISPFLQCPVQVVQC
uniref:Uncharacterized protein n=1 Tax=Pelusios castaneus TaxID=367368 RepID=A0A8C8S3I5_9SAUR